MQNNNKKILALDFDGVLWDSAQENWETGYLAYQKFSDKLKYNKKNNKKFLEARYLARSGEDFYFIFKLIDINPDLNLKKITTSKWSLLKKKYAINAEAFTKEFYKIRHYKRENEYQSWSKIQKPYPHMIKEIKKLKKYFHICIASAKDIRSIELQLKDYKFDFEIFGREHSIHKYEQLEMLKNKHHVKYSDIYFIDDCIENLEPLIDTGINIFMALWGYNSKREREKAKKMGIRLVGLKGLTEQILGDDTINHRDHRGLTTENTEK